MSEYWSKYWYLGKLCVSLFVRPGWYVSLGVHVGAEVELHLGWCILIVSSAEWARGMEEADRYYLEGIEPE